MKLFYLFLILFLFSSNSVYSQNNQDSIVGKKSLFGYRFFQNGKKISMIQTEGVLRSNYKSFYEFRRAKNNHILSTTSGMIGGYLIGYQLGKQIANNYPRWGIAGLGIGLLLCSFIIDIKVTNQFTNALHIYNKNRNTSFILRKYELHFIVKQNQVGFELKL